MWQDIIAVIQQHTRFLISSHINPDCDALGSELALAEHLERCGKQAIIINTDRTAPNYRFLDPKRRIKQYSLKKHAALMAQAEVIVVVDASGGWDRLGPIGPALSQTRAIKLCIDHHPDTTDFVDLAVVDIHAAATAELIFDLIAHMGQPLTLTMAQALYAAIITDTGSFRFPKTSPRTHRLTAELVEVGIDPLHIYRQIYEQNQLGAVQVKGQIMASIQTTMNGQIAYYNVSQATLKKFKAKASDLDGVATLGQLISGVRVSIFCSELSNGRVKISLRSDGSISINQIAVDYGGGGHPSAAGAIVLGQLEAVLAEVVGKVEAQLAALGVDQ